MKRLAYLTGVMSSLLLLTSTAHAWLQPPPCNLGFQAEFVYLRPSIDDNYFVIQSSSPTFLDGERYYNRFHYQAGFRLEGAYTLGCSQMDARFRWTYVNAKQHRTVSGANLSPTQGLPALSLVTYDGLADSQVKSTFNNAEGLIGQQIWGGACNRLNLYARAGIQYSSIHYRENVIYSTGVTTDDIHYKNHVWGGGPEVSVDGAYNITHLNCWLDNCLTGNLLLTARASTALLVSRSNNQYTERLDGGPLNNLQDKHLWRLIPTWHVRLGLAYSTCLFCCTRAVFELGYECTSYYHAISKIRFNDDVVTGNSFNQFMNFDLHGPYAAVAFTF